MASKPVPPQHMRAGQDYLDVLVSLGLVPAYLGWGWEQDASQWVLVLVTSIVDAGGPLALNKLLFRAYNANVTPKEISPFIVRIFSPDMVPGGARSNFWVLGSKAATVRRVPGKVKNPMAALAAIPIQNFEMGFFGLHLEMINSYETKPGAIARAFASYHAQRHDWLSFRRNVERLAA